MQFYRHDIDWTNRLILGDSLQVMSSLARREDLGGKVQMIYVDPPYGIKFASNFQPVIGDRTVNDNERDLTREPEMVKAYRDTLGLSPGVRQTVKTLFAVRWNCIVLRTGFLAKWAPAGEAEVGSAGAQPAKE